MSNTNSEDTRLRLIVSAGELFAEHGFKGTTVRAIGSRANANIASINYHFVSKAGLYSAVVAHILDYLHERYPLESEAMRSAKPSEQLYIFVLQNLMRRHNQDRPRWFSTILSRELIEPQPQTCEYGEKMKNKFSEILGRIITGLTGIPTEDSSVVECTKSIIGQLLLSIHGGPAPMRSCHDTPEKPLTENEITAIARHITDFSLGGIERISKQYKKNKSHRGG